MHELMAQDGGLIDRPRLEQDGVTHGAAGLPLAAKAVAPGLLTEIHVLGHGKSVQHHDTDVLQLQHARKRSPGGVLA
jgi:hypothetical protein